MHLANRGPGNWTSLEAINYANQVREGRVSFWKLLKGLIMGGAVTLEEAGVSRQEFAAWTSCLH